jgi:hypothetical protein
MNSNEINPCLYGTLKEETLLRFASVRFHFTSTGETKCMISLGLLASYDSAVGVFLAVHRFLHRLCAQLEFQPQVDMSKGMSTANRAQTGSRTMQPIEA